MINLGVLEAVLRLKDNLTPAITNARRKLQDSALRMAKSVALIGTAAIGAFTIFGAHAAAAASRAEETQNLFEVSFGDMAADAEEWAARTQAAVGVNDTTLKQMSGTLFNMVTSMGVAREGAFAMSTGFTQLALDASSFFDIPFERSFQVIQAGLAGEVEGLRRLGVDVTEATLKQLDFVKAIEASGRELSQAEKIQARAIAITQGMQNAQNDLIRTQDSWANQTRLVGEAWTGLLENIGTLITKSPTVARLLALVTDMLNNMASGFDTNRDAIVEFVEAGLARIVEAAANVLDAFAEIGSAVRKLGELLQAGQAIREWMGLEPIEDDLARRGAEIEEFGQSLETMGDRARNAADELRGMVEPDATESLGNLEQDMASFSGQADIATEAVDEQREAVKELEPELDTYNKLIEALGTNQATVQGELTKSAQKALEKKRAVEELNTALANAVAPMMGIVEPLEIQRRTLVGLGPLVNNYNFTMMQVERTLFEYNNTATDANKENQAFGQSLQQAADFAQIFGNRVGSLIGQVTTFGAGLRELASGGIGNIFSNLGDMFGEASDKAGGGFLGAIAGAANLAGPIGALAGPIVSALGGLFGGPDVEGVMRDAARDLGADISEQLAREIAERDQPVALALADIIREGGIEVDRAFQEVGDLFSFIEQGGDRAAAIRTIEESVALLLPRLGELGERGQAEVERIIAAADRLGIEFEGLDQLMQSTFAPDTLETMAEKFGLTIQQAREMAKTIGIDVQTNLERMAASVGLTAEEFRALGSAMQEQLGIPAEQLKEFLESTGISAGELADKLGVDVGGGAQLAADAQSRANERLREGVDFAAQLRRELEGAASASRNINVPGAPPSFQHGGFVPETFPSGRIVRVAEPGTGGEDIVPRRGARGSVGGGTTDEVVLSELRAIRETLEQHPREIGRAVRDEVRKR